MYSTVSGENLEVLLVSVILFRFSRFGCFGGLGRFVSLFRVLVHAHQHWCKIRFSLENKEDL